MAKKRKEENKGSEKEEFIFRIKKSHLLFIGLGIALAITIILLVNFSSLFVKIKSGGTSLLINNYIESPVAKATLELFVMSQCPYGIQAENEAIKVAEKFGKELNFKLYFIATELDDGSFRSLHGQSEVNEDIRQLCIIKYNPDEFFNYLRCLNKNYRRVDDVWEDCALSVGVDLTKVRRCSEGLEGKQLLSENIKESKKRGVGASPTYFINGVRYSGGRDENSLIRTLCKEIKSKVCSQIPEEPKVKLYVINDENCSICDASQIINSLKTFFTTLEIENLEYNSKKGEEMLEKFNIKTIPAFIFDASVLNHSNYEQIERFMESKDNFYHLRTAGKKFIERDEIKRRVDLFIMSKCPFGNKANDAMNEVVSTLPITLKIHYIANYLGENKFSSLHGQSEINEDIRQVCAMHYYPNNYFNYILCIAKDFSNAELIWKNCTKKANMSVAVIENCSKGNKGIELLKDNILLTKELNVGNSPTFLINNQIVQKGYMSAESIKNLICNVNKGMSGCEKTLSKETNVGGAC